MNLILGILIILSKAFTAISACGSVNNSWFIKSNLLKILIK